MTVLLKKTLYPPELKRLTDHNKAKSDIKDLNYSKPHSQMCKF